MINFAVELVQYCTVSSKIVHMFSSFTLNDPNIYNDDSSLTFIFSMDQGTAVTIIAPGFCVSEPNRNRVRLMLG
ncbi:hypothetical protein BB560_005424, partial [Smittium megazygosporum]